MSSSSTTTEPQDLQSQRERLLKVFEFLKAYTELCFYPPVTDIGQQMRPFLVEGFAGPSSRWWSGQQRFLCGLWNPGMSRRKSSCA